MRHWLVAQSVEASASKPRHVKRHKLEPQAQLNMLFELAQKIVSKCAFVLCNLVFVKLYEV